MSDCGNWRNDIYEDDTLDFDDFSYPDDFNDLNDFNRGRIDGRTFQTEPFEDTRIVREFAAPRTYTDYVWYEVKYVGPFRTGAVVGEPSQADLARNERIAERASNNNYRNEESRRNRCTCQRRNRCCCDCCRRCR